MSEDGFSDPYDEPSMDLIIETLTGTSFEMRVFPTDTVLDIKNKIHRVEGIPVHHQNLLFQMKELQDYIRLCDAGIVNGSTLKLVLSMRGGPISTRRLSTCDHHIIWKDLKDLIEHTRDEIGDKSGSKVSVLVFKEGEVINVIRVIENEDGSYSPYTDKAISPPYSRYKEKEDLQQTFFKKISEDMEMATKMHLLRSKMKKLRQQRHPKPSELGGKGKPKDGGGGGDFIEIELPGDDGHGCKLEKSRLHCLDDYKMIENIISVQENVADPLENLEIALKEKHRTRVRGGYDKTKKSPDLSRTSDTKPYFCKNLHIFEPDKKEQSDEEKIINNSILSPLYNRYSSDNNLRHRRTSHFESKLNFDDTSRSDPIAIIEDSKQDENTIEVPCAETLSLTARNRVHLARLVIQDPERGKSSPDSIELEENSPEMWEIQPETIKPSGAYKVGLLKRRSSVDHNYEPDFPLDSSTNNLEREDFNKNTEYEVFGRNFYHVPQFVSTPSAIPPQYAPKDERICDLYLGSPVSDTKIRRSPLYGRRSKNNANMDYSIYTDDDLGRSFDEKKMQNSSSGSSTQFFPKLHTKNENNFSELASNIERLQNDYTELDYEDFDVNYGDDMFGYYNATCTSDIDKLLSCNHPRYKEAGWNEVERLKGSDDAQLANEIKRLSFDLKVDDEKRGKVQIETTKLEDLPAVVSKKHMRCGQCNKRLNITNIYNCRCGRIFCSQHRYSESHDCKYDYKSEGRKLLEQQNPLVTATKLTKF